MVIISTSTTYIKRQQKQWQHLAASFLPLTSGYSSAISRHVFLGSALSLLLAAQMVCPAIMPVCGCSHCHTSTASTLSDLVGCFPAPPSLRPSLGSQLLSASITVTLPTAIPSGRPSAQLRRGGPSGALVLDLGCSWQASDSRTTWQCHRVQSVRLRASDSSNLTSLFLSVFYVLPEPFAYSSLG